MGGSIRIYAFAVIFVTLIITTAVIGTRGGAFSTSSTTPPEPEVNLIAFVDLEGSIKTMRPDGSSVAQISPEDGIFTWPSWSPDATQVAFSGITLQDDMRSPLTLFVLRFGDDEPKTIYTNKPDMGPILVGMPHYALWSPDSKRLSFMASTPEGLTIFIDDLHDNSESQVVLRNSPLYAAWSSDSDYLIVHGNVDHFLVDVNDAGNAIDLGIRSSRYRTPAWWSSGNGLAYVADDPTGRASLYSSEPTSESRILIDEAPGNTAFLWSPDGQSLAVARPGQALGAIAGFVYQGVTFFSPDGVRQSLEIDENVIAYFWSPDSTKLAYVTLSDTRGALRWNILDVQDDARWPLVDFLPTQDQLSIFQFFDQFAYSQSMWSPDSRSLVFAGSIVDEGVSASLRLQPVSQIIVLDTEPNPAVQPIADGLLGTWSPR